MGGDWNINTRKIHTKHPNCVEVGECRPPHRGGKQTRWWCKGKVGIPHTYEWLRQPSDLERERRYGWQYNRITEVPVCFGCGRIDYRWRHYCRQCGEPWPELHHGLQGTPWRRRMTVLPCVRCGAPWTTKARVGGVYVASGSVLR